MPGEHLDLSSEQPAPRRAAAEEARKFIGVHFACCDVYSRVYVNRDRSAYIGHCPRCAKPVRFTIGPGGSDSRMFQAS
ncbi:hypothetical protein Pan181_16140 [Aeoliella mucimassa]|uniref:Uncharacterized protein n=2 Tax=Aeoliella mucimassa TaxID=2527972 RepID=A0A518AL14_9BACT|nr:hypothetical protein Pan181_16140 [Aeoliella mucimassa]